MDIKLMTKTLFPENKLQMFWKKKKSTLPEIVWFMRA